MSKLDKDAFVIAIKAHYEADCGLCPCNASNCACLNTAITAYISHVAASPSDLRAVLAYDAGLAEGRRRGLEEAAKWHDGVAKREAALAARTHQTPEKKRHKFYAQSHMIDAAAIRALITKEPTT